MTIGDIQSAIAKYLQRDVSAFDVGTSGKNLILTALNHARKYAERRHNFSVCRQRGYLLVSAGGKVAWDSPTWFDGGSEKMKEGVSWWTRPDATDTSTEYSVDDVPIKVISSGVKEQLERRRQYEDWTNEWNNSERQLWQSGVNHPLLGQPYALTRGKWLELHPSANAETMLVVDGYRWWENWSETDVANPSRWSITIPVESYAAYDDESYLYINCQNTEQTRLIYIYLDDALDGTSISTLPSPYNSGIAPVMGLDAILFTPTNVRTALQTLGWEIEATNVSSKIIMEGSEPTGSFTLYNSATGDYEFATTVSPVDINEPTDVSDWWTENASEFLMWRGIVEANRLNQMFVGNKEGNLSPPEKEAERALQELIAQDIASEMNGAQLEFLA